MNGGGIIIESRTRWGPCSRCMETGWSLVGDRFSENAHGCRAGGNGSVAIGWRWGDEGDWEGELCG